MSRSPLSSSSLIRETLIYQPIYFASINKSTRNIEFSQLDLYFISYALFLKFTIEIFLIKKGDISKKFLDTKRAIFLINFSNREI